MFLPVIKTSCSSQLAITAIVSSYITVWAILVEMVTNSAFPTHFIILKLVPLHRVSMPSPEPTSRSPVFSILIAITP